MNLERADKNEIVIHIPMKEAGDTLKALTDLKEALGEHCRALAKALSDAGVTLPREEDHRRYEYMTPPDMK